MGLSQIVTVQFDAGAAASRAALLNPRDGHIPTNGKQLAFCFTQFGREQKHLSCYLAELLA